MKQTLVYGNRKQDSQSWDISTPAKREKAIRALFNILKDDWKVYTCGYWGETPAEEKVQKDFYKAACEGNVGAMEALLVKRNGYEYENWHIEKTPEKKNGVNVIRLKKGDYEIKEIRTDGHSGDMLIFRFNLKSAKGDSKDVELGMVPMRASFRDWDSYNRVIYWLRDHIDTQFADHKERRAELQEVLNHMNYMRVVLWNTMHPGTQNPKNVLPKMQQRALERAKDFIQKYSVSPLEALVVKPKTPTTLEEAQTQLAEALRQIDSLKWELKQEKKVLA